MTNNENNKIKIQTRPQTRWIKVTPARPTEVKESWSSVALTQPEIQSFLSVYTV